MSTYSRFEAQFASAIVGVVLLLLAIAAWFPNDYEPLHQVLHAKGRDDDFALSLAIVGAITLYGSLQPKRNCRQLGLFLAMVFLLPMAWIMLLNWGFSLATLISMTFGLMAVVLLAADVICFRRDCDVQGH